MTALLDQPIRMQQSLSIDSACNSPTQCAHLVDAILFFEENIKQNIIKLETEVFNWYWFCLVLSTR
jgi:hypothetical protein